MTLAHHIIGSGSGSNNSCSSTNTSGGGTSSDCGGGCSSCPCSGGGGGGSNRSSSSSSSSGSSSKAGATGPPRLAAWRCAEDPGRTWSSHAEQIGTWGSLAQKKNGGGTLPYTQVLQLGNLLSPHPTHIFATDSGHSSTVRERYRCCLLPASPTADKRRQAPNRVATGVAMFKSPV